MQLVAYGAQDIYLTGNPQITFFKVVYRRHTNFAVESIEQTINGSVSKGSKVSVTVARNGDLLSRVYIQLKGTLGTESGFDTVDYVEVEVGGQVIDKHYGQWMKIWCDLTHGGDKKAMLNDMLCSGANCGCGVGSDTTLTTIPLQFWFCRNPGLALPLIALQYHEVKLNIKFCDVASASAEVWCDYIFLDTDERRRFAQVSHEYLIEQVQYNNGVAFAEDVQTELRFNHPVKELIWQTRDTASCCGNRPGLAGTCTAVLQLNGHDRFRKREGQYFSTVQRYEHHSGAPTGRNHTEPVEFRTAEKQIWEQIGAGTIDLATGTGDIHTELQALRYATAKGEATKNLVDTFNQLSSNLGITVAAQSTAAEVAKFNDANLVYPCVNAGVVYMYSFALKPEEHQPSGTCNFSRIDNAVLNVERTSVGAVLDVYAVNYNVLRIMSGMGGLAYSN